MRMVPKPDTPGTTNQHVLVLQTTNLVVCWLKILRHIR